MDLEKVVALSWAKLTIMTALAYPLSLNLGA
jgi:hypothetical protein